MKNEILLQPIILCGGFGSRLWPLSKKSLPKQFLKIIDGKSLFELTLDRLKHLNNCREPIIISSKKYKFKIEDILLKKNIKAKLIFEPIAKNTGAAIFFSSYLSKDNDFLLIMPSDHFIPDVSKFKKIINFSLKQINKDNWMIFGVKPKKPSEDYGHIKIDYNKIIKKDNENIIYKIDKFVEKPNLAVAKKYYLSKKFLFNSGIFLVNREKALSSIKFYAKDLYLTCEDVLKSLEPKILEKSISLETCAFKKIPSISIDKAVIEKENNILCSLFNTSWDDIGSWDSYFEIINGKFNKNVNSVEIDGQNKVLTSRDRMIATVGVDNLLVIDTQDTTLITKKNNSKNLKKLVETLVKKTSPYVENIFYEERPWGSFEILFDSKFCKVKKIVVFSGKRLSLQYHKRRSEHWFIVSGIADIHIDGKEFSLKAGESTDVKRGSKHYLANTYHQDLIIIEIQLGDYFGEDDIIRLDDPYNRE